MIFGMKTYFSPFSLRKFIKCKIKGAMKNLFLIKKSDNLKVMTHAVTHSLAFSWKSYVYFHFRKSECKTVNSNSTLQF